MTDVPADDRRRRTDPPTWAPVPDPTTLTLALVDREIEHVKQLVDLQFTLIERQRVESKTDTKEALAAALAAQEKAAGVLATFTSDQLKALQTSQTTQTDQIRKDIAELKEGSKTSAGKSQGGKEVVAYIFAAAAFVAALTVIAAFALSR